MNVVPYSTPSDGQRPSAQRLAPNFHEGVAGFVVGAGDADDLRAVEFVDVVAGALLGAAGVGGGAGADEGIGAGVGAGQRGRLVTMVVPVQDQVGAGARQH